ncbi:hypothetical protein HWV62_23735 [Athelia sp. TMB]|nr:hypothetical protein HWV62_23735 [Athelia sp. TMB]
MPNPTGENQWGKKKYPPDDELIAAFIQYGKEKNGSGLNAEEQLARLEKEFGLRIGKRTLTTLRKRLLIPSVRKNPVAAQDRMQAVLDVKQHDIAEPHPNSLESAPEFTIEEWPPWVGVQSKKNTPIEGFWRWKRAGEGHSIRQAILVGKNEGIFNPANPRHMCVYSLSVVFHTNSTSHSDIFNWLWPRLVQERLDEFREYWNNHKLSKQQKKILPSGTSPRHMWLVPSSVRATARDCSVRVNMESVRRLRDEMGGHEGREEAMQFVSREFSAEADSALGQLGYPTITLSTAWDVFVAVDDILSHV